MAEPGWRGPALVLGAGVAMFAWAALYNGYPLLFADSGTHIRAALDLYVPPTRPVVYSLSLLPQHLGLTLWPVVAWQGLVAAWLLHLTCRVAWPAPLPARWQVAILALLSALTALPWFTGQAMPDLYTGLLVLGWFLLACGGERLARWERWLVLVATAGGIASATSHVGLALGLLLATGLAALLPAWRRRLGRPALGWPAAATALALAAVVGANWVAHGQAVLSPNSSLFAAGRLIGSGVAQRYLADVCPADPSPYCTFRDSLPDDTNEFLWRSHPLKQALDGAEFRDASAKLVRAALARYWPQQLWATLRDGTLQLGHVDATQALISYDDSYAVHIQVKRWFPAEYPQFLASRQQTERLPSSTLHLVHATVLLAALLAAPVLAWLGWRRGWRAPLALLALIVLALLGNALLNGALSVIDDRYGARLAWLLPFWSLAAGAALIALRPGAPAAR